MKACIAAMEKYDDNQFFYLFLDSFLFLWIGIIQLISVFLQQKFFKRLPFHFQGMPFRGNF